MMRQHGTNVKYTKDSCRCKLCTIAHTRYSVGKYYQRRLEQTGVDGSRKKSGNPFGKCKQCGKRHDQAKICLQNI